MAQSERATFKTGNRAGNKGLSAAGATAARPDLCLRSWCALHSAVRNALALCTMKPLLPCSDLPARQSLTGVRKGEQPGWHGQAQEAEGRDG
eukprot:2599603-Prymnesium_polylepis.1